MSFHYTKKAPNPLEYSVDTGKAHNPTDFKVVAKDIPCQNACPARTNVPEYIRLIKEGEYDHAHLIVLDTTTVTVQAALFLGLFPGIFTGSFRGIIFDRDMAGLTADLMEPFPVGRYVVV